jgi:hypothetical protein
MLAAVADLPKEIKDEKDKINYHEWSLSDREGIDMFKKFKARSLPSIAIDGELQFESLIPTEEDLVNAITKNIKGIDG